jgi:hypothetical protein
VNVDVGDGKGIKDLFKLSNFHISIMDPDHRVNMKKQSSYEYTITTPLSERRYIRICIY